LRTIDWLLAGRGYGSQGQQSLTSRHLNRNLTIGI